MKLVKSIKCRLQVNQTERETLLQTINAFAQACNDILAIAREKKDFNQYRLHHLTYHLIKDRYHLQANLVIRAIARVAQKRKKRPKSFKARSFNLDIRTFRFVERKETVSLSTINGRLKLKLSLSNYHRAILTGQNPKSATLFYQKSKKVFYICFVLEKEVVTPRGSNSVGIDLGINNIATASNGLQFSGKQAKHIRKHFQQVRSSLQAKGTKGAKKTLIRLSGKEKRIIAQINHTISRRIVNSLKEGDAVAMEKLTHIRENTTVRKKQRYLHNSWSFAQLQSFITYKALERGILTVLVDPRNTSHLCPRCGQLGSRIKHSFSCSCGYRNNADFVGAFNISKRGFALLDGLPVNQPLINPILELKTPTFRTE
jgi:IS605 OrfB family transposase